MDKNYLIQLTQNLYRLTLLFPKKEPLRYKIREVADDILTKGLKIKLEENPILEDLEILDSFFEVAKAQNWVSSVELLRLQEEYKRIKAEIKKIPKQLTKEEISRGQTSGKFAEVRPWSVLNERQEKILAFLKENGRAQVQDIKKLFPEVSKRTLRRDFAFLLKQGKIERRGERNKTFYQLKS